MGRRPAPPKHEDVVLANLDLLADLPNVFAYEGGPVTVELVRRLAATCWGCGYSRPGHWAPNRAHVVPHSRGGSNDPGNYFLLCDPCHDEQPGGMPRGLQVDWLLGRECNLAVVLSVSRQMVGELVEIAGEGGIELVEQFTGAVGERRLGALIAGGYGAAAGWRNGRANAFVAVKNEFRRWLLCRRFKRGPRPRDGGVRAGVDQDAGRAEPGAGPETVG